MPKTTFIQAVVGSALLALCSTPALAQFTAITGFTTSRIQGLSPDGRTAAGYGIDAQPKLGAFTLHNASNYDLFGFSVQVPTDSYGFATTNGGAFTVGDLYTNGADVNTRRAYRRQAGGGFEVLGNLGDRNYARGVSADGNVVVGTSEIGTLTDAFGQAFRWTPQTGMQGLGFLRPGSSYSKAYGVSQDGTAIVGYSRSAGIGERTEAYVWRQETGMVALPGISTHPNAYAAAYAVNRDGTVAVGYSSSDEVNFNPRAVRWINGVPQNLGVVPGTVRSLAYAVNGDGSVVGGTGALATGGPQAFIWTEADGMRSLMDVLIANGISVPSGWRFNEVTSISDDGMTFGGYGRSPTNQFQGFVVTIPAPSGGMLLALGGVVALRRRR